MRFFRNVDIERIAEQRLVEYEARFGENQWSAGSYRETRRPSVWSHSPMGPN